MKALHKEVIEQLVVDATNKITEAIELEWSPTPEQLHAQQLSFYQDKIDRSDDNLVNIRLWEHRRDEYLASVSI